MLPEDEKLTQTLFGADNRRYIGVIARMSENQCGRKFTLVNRSGVSPCCLIINVGAILR
nr:MAG TPA: hypothetical protein [Caudoviricetes sp.]